MQNPKRKNGDVSRASSFPSPKPHGPGRKKIQHRRVHVFGELSLDCRVHTHKIMSTQPRKTEHRTRLQLCTSQWCQNSENEGMLPSAQNSGPKMSLDDHAGNSFQHHSKGLETSGPETTSSTSITSSNVFQGSSRQPSRASGSHPNHRALTQHVAGCLPSRP